MQAPPGLTLDFDAPISRPIQSSVDGASSTRHSRDFLCDEAVSHTISHFAALASSTHRQHESSHSSRSSHRMSKKRTSKSGRKSSSSSRKSASH